MLRLGPALVVSALVATWAAGAEATYSVVAVDTRDGTVGGAVASCVPGAILETVYGAVPGKGALMTQSYLKVGANADGLALFEAGSSASEVIAALTAPAYDAGFQLRQYAAVDTFGGVITFTGTDANQHASGVSFSEGGFAVAIQGNYLTGPEVIEQARAAFTSSRCDLAARLHAALAAAGSNGAGDRRCTPDGVPAQSAILEVDPPNMTIGSFLRLAHEAPGDPPAEDPVAKLGVDLDAWRASHPCPVEEGGGGAAPAPEPEPEPEPSGARDENDGCAAAPGRSAGAGGWLGLALVILVAARRGRCPSRASAAVARRALRNFRAHAQRLVVIGRCFWAALLSTLAVACGSDPEPGGPEGGGGASGEGGSSTSSGGGGQAPWTSGTANFAVVWESAITCTGTVGSRLGEVFVTGGDVFLAGTVDGDCTLFGAGPTAAGSEAVVAARLSGADGATIWTRADPVGGLFGFGTAGLGAGGLVIHGGFDAPFQLEGGALLDPVVFSDHSPAFTTFLVTLDEAGAVAASRALAVEHVGAHLDVEPSGSVAIVGGPYEANLGGGPHPSELSHHPVAQLDAAGGEVWSGVVGADFPAIFYAHEVAIGADRRTLLTATLLGAMTFGADALETTAKSSPVLAFFDATGAPARALALQASDEGCVLHPFALVDGSFLVTGACGGTLAIGPDVVGAPGAPLAIAMRLSSGGDLLWARTFEGPIDQVHVAESATGLVLAGRFHETIDLGDGALESAGLSDIFLAGLDPSGATLWSQRMGDEWDNSIEGLATLGDDLVVTSISSLDPGASPTGEGFTLLGVARLRE